MLYNTIIYYYLIIKTFMLNLYVSIKSKFFEIDKVDIINNNGRITSLLLRYYLISFLTYIMELIKDIVDKIDIQTNNIQIIKENIDEKSTLILDAKLNFGKDKLCLKDVVNYFNTLSSDPSIDPSIDNSNINSNKIFITFEIQDPLKGSICIKEYVMRYKDQNKLYGGHTLENIIAFNEIDINRDTSNVYIVFFENSKRIINTIPYTDCKQWHISTFPNI